MSSVDVGEGKKFLNSNARFTGVSCVYQPKELGTLKSSLEKDPDAPNLLRKDGTAGRSRGEERRYMP